MAKTKKRHRRHRHVRDGRDSEIQGDVETMRP